MTLFSLALRNLLAHKLRTFATLAGILLAVSSFIALVGLARGIELTLRSSLEVRGTDIVVTEAGAADLMSSIVADRLAEEMSHYPGINAAAAELTRLTTLEKGGSSIVVAWPADGFPWETLEIVEGRLPVAGDRQKAVIGESLAQRNGLHLGDTILLFQTEFRIIGVIGSKSVLTRNLVLVLLSDAQRLTYREGQATSINVRLDATGSREGKKEIVSGLRQAYKDYSVEETEKLAENYMFAQVADVLSWSISTVALISAIFAILNTMSMAVNERRGEIAIMSAVGWTPTRIILCIVMEGVLLSAAAGFLGSLVGIAVAYTVSLSPSIAGFIEPEISPALILQAAAITLGIGLVGSLLPALRTVAMSPADVLRGK